MCPQYHVDSARFRSIIELSIDSTGGPVIAIDQGLLIPSIERGGEGKSLSEYDDRPTELISINGALSSTFAEIPKEGLCCGFKTIMAGIIIPKRSHIDLMKCNFHQYVRPSPCHLPVAPGRQPSLVPQIVS